MNAFKIVALILIVAGVLGLAYGGVTYTKETHRADIGPLHVAVSDKKTVNIPVWAGAGSVLAGALMLLVGKKRS
jgi:hypothetical protein